MLRFFHTLHSCGHAVYWQEPVHAILASHYPCLWCGSERGVARVPLDSLFVGTLGPCAGLVVRKPLEDNTFPLPPGFDPGGDARVAIMHMTGDVCCRRAKPWPDGW